MPPTSTLLSWPPPVDDDVGDILQLPRPKVKSTDYRWEAPMFTKGRAHRDAYAWLVTDHAEFPDGWINFIAAFLDAQTAPSEWVRE
jgi:hypothetical protein